MDLLQVREEENRNMGWKFFVFFVMGIGEAKIEFDFLKRYTGKSPSRFAYLLYWILFCIVTIIGGRIESNLFVLITQMILLIGSGCFFYSCSFFQGIFLGVIIITIKELSFGIISILSYILVSVWNIDGSWYFMELGVGIPIVSLLLIYKSCQIIIKKFRFKDIISYSYLLVLLFPTLLVFVISEFISNTIYGKFTIVAYEQKIILQPGVNHIQMLLLQIFAFISFYCTLFIYQRVTEGFSKERRLALLEQETIAQKEYVREAKEHYRQTQAFRHDIKSHLLVLEGLLEKQEVSLAKEYLKKLEEISVNISFLWKTGNLAVDILINTKLRSIYQEGIQVECEVQIPNSCNVEDFEFCIIFSNLIDNAEKACKECRKSDKFIQISSRVKGDFWVLEIENSYLMGYYKKGMGIGLENVRTIVKKYKGDLVIEEKEERFRIRILLIISR